MYKIDYRSKYYSWLQPRNDKDMTTKAATTLSRLNAELDEWSQILNTYTHEQLNCKPADGGWSAMQCVHHLMLSESGIMAYINKKLSFSPNLPDKGFADLWKRMLLIGYLKSPVKFKAPNGIGTQYLPEESEFESTLDLWKNQRKKMLDELNNIRPEYYRKRVFKHPMAGRVSIETTLAFVLAHNKRHRKQAMRALNDQNR